MQLDELCLFHLAKSKITSDSGILKNISSNHEGVFYLDTCQRWLWVCHSRRAALLEKELSSLGLQNMQNSGPARGPTRGKDAYLFLLRLASGLESQVIGETDVFGQLKDAWRKYQQSGDAFSAELSPWLRRVFEDTKEIRTRYLQNLGGVSYGSLVRKFIKDQQKDQQPEDIKKPILIVGAGKIAQAVAPFLLEHELLLLNRDSKNLTAFHESISKKPRSQVRRLDISFEEICSLDDVWENIGQIVMCIPMDAEQDFIRVSRLKEKSEKIPSIIHLGGIREHSGSWSSLPQFYCLTDLFQLQNSLNNVRSVQISYAERTCEERAKLRALSTSLSVSHCWEDLAVFA